MSIRLKRYEAQRLRNKNSVTKIRNERKKLIEFIQKGNDQEAIKSRFESFDKNIQKIKSKGILKANKVSNVLTKLAKLIRKNIK